MKRPLLTRKDLFSAESSGFGYLGHECRTLACFAGRAANEADFSPYAAIELRDNAVLDAANKMKLTAAEFAAFLDSKAGRWLGDAMGPEVDALKIRDTAYSAISGWAVKERS